MAKQQELNVYVESFIVTNDPYLLTPIQRIVDELKDLYKDV